jgi:DNA-binding transcriptional LysR family regulator
MDRYIVQRHLPLSMAYRLCQAVGVGEHRLSASHDGCDLDDQAHGIGTAVLKGGHPGVEVMTGIVDGGRFDYQTVEWDVLVQKWMESMIELDDIALFVDVVRAGSFAEAGRRLGIPPSTGSRRIQQLERRLGVRLMQRSTRRLALTDAGHTFFTRCAEQVDALTQSAQELIDASKSPAGKVRVAVPVDFFSWFPLELIAKFLADHPGVRLEFELSDTRADLLRDGIDVALRAGKIVEPTLVARQIASGRLTMVASPAYLAAHGTPTLPQDLSVHDCITQPTRTGAPTTWRLDGPDGSTELPVNGRFQANTTQAQLGAAVAGLGIALLPTLMTDPYIQQGELREILPGHGLEDVGVYFVYLSRKQIPRAVSAFTEFAMTTMLERKLTPASSNKSHKDVKPAGGGRSKRRHTGA